MWLWSNALQDVFLQSLIISVVPRLHILCLHLRPCSFDGLLGLNLR